MFIHLLLNANIKDADFQTITVHRGQLVTSYPRLSNSLEMSIQSIRTALGHLKLTGEITVKAYPKFSVITVVNYDKYQSNQQANQQATNSQSTGNQQATNNNQRNKEIKNGKNKRNIDSNESIKDVFEAFAENDPLLLEALKNFEQMRKTIKKPLSDNAKVLLLKKLETMPHGDWVEILNNSVMNSWQGIFPLKRESTHESNNGYYTLSNGNQTTNAFLAMLDEEVNGEQNRSNSSVVDIESCLPASLQGNGQGGL